MTEPKQENEPIQRADNLPSHNEEHQPAEPSVINTQQHVEVINGTRSNAFLAKSWSIISYTPKRCRWNPQNPPKFTIWLNLLFAFAGTFTVANLYYNHPILNILAQDFRVTYERVSIVPTVMQAGYATGLLFLNPLGDLFRRRPFVLILVWFTGTVVGEPLARFHRPCSPGPLLALFYVLVFAAWVLDIPGQPKSLGSTQFTGAHVRCHEKSLYG